MSAASAQSHVEAPSERYMPLRLAQYIGYGAGDAANNLAFSMTSLFLLLYYTDVVGIAATRIGPPRLVVRDSSGS